MATKVGVSQRGANKPDYAAANSAIDDILAKHAFDTKGRGLKRSYKQAKQSYTRLSRREQAKGVRVEAMGTSLTGQAQAVEYQNKQVQAASRQMGALQGQWNEQALKQTEAWTNSFNEDERYVGLDDKQRTAAFQDYYQRKSRQLPIYQNAIKNQQRLSKRLSRGAQSGYKSYQQGAAAYDKQRKGLTQAGNRKMGAYERYEDAIKRYNRHNAYVPYSRA